MSTISEIAKKLSAMERKTLTGEYKPYGAHACAIHEYLENAGLVDHSGALTLFGHKVRGYIINEHRRNFAAKAEEKSSRTD